MIHRFQTLFFGAVVLWIAFSAPAQEPSFALTGTVVNTEGLPLPDASVALASDATAHTVTDEQGRFRLAVPRAGSYEVIVALEGFESVRFSVVVDQDPSHPPHVAITLEPSSELLTELLTLSHASPLAKVFDLWQDELRRLPVASSPWAALELAPGVLLDRVNVGGIEDGTQPGFVIMGSAPGNATWIYEGLNITDLVALGGSPTFFDAGAFERVTVKTGGSDSDSTLATAGPTIEIVTGHGSNFFRGSARYLLADGGWRAGEGRLDQVSELGAEAGGALIEDRFWAWGSYGREEIERRSLDGIREPIELSIASAKLVGQLSESNTATLFAHHGEKEAAGRGASAVRPPETTWNQGGVTEIYKLEDTHILTPNLYLKLLAGRVDGGFDLDPRGGDDVNVVRGPDGRWRNSFQRFSTDRDSDEARLDGGLFFGGAWAHELRFGAGYREAESRSISAWPGQQVVGLADIEVGRNIYLAFSATDGVRAEEVKVTSFHLDDTLRHGALTARAGLRYDRQEGNNLSSTVDPAPLHPTDLPGGRFAGQDGGFNWESVSPRLALRYALGLEQQTSVEATYAQFADQLGTGIAGLINPMRAGYLYFYWYDDNSDLELTADEVGFFRELLPAFDRAGDPLPDPDSIDPDLEAPTTRELTLGVEHRFGDDFLLGLTGTWRQTTDLLERERLVREGFGGEVRTHRRSDYEPVATPAVVAQLPDGTPTRLELYRLRPGISPTGGVRLENGDREQEARVLTLWGQLRPWRGLTASGHLSWHDWDWRVPDSENEDPTPLVPGAYEDGEAVLVPPLSSTDDRRDVFMNAGWSYSLAASYDIAAEKPWGFAVGAHLHGREGYPLAYSRQLNLGDGLGARRVLLVPENDAIRLDDVHLLDLRLAKPVTLGPVVAELSLDLFNALDDDTVLQRNTSLNTSQAGAVREVLEPRTLRVGLRILLE